VSITLTNEGFVDIIVFMLAHLLSGLRDLIYPDCCLICKNKLNQEHNPVCANCLRKIEMNLPPFCADCGRHLDQESIARNICRNCKNNKFHFDKAFSPCIYTGAIKKLIHEFKYKYKDYLGEYFSSLMNDFIRTYNLPIEHLDYIVPIPLYKSRLREREFNQSQVLASLIAKEFGKKELSGILIRNKANKTQAGLNFKQRQQNVLDCFCVSDPQIIKDTDLLLIDDVLTTAATSDEAAKCLKNAGAKTVILLTLAN